MLFFSLSSFPSRTGYCRWFNHRCSPSVFGNFTEDNDDSFSSTPTQVFPPCPWDEQVSPPVSRPSCICISQLTLTRAHPVEKSNTSLIQFTTPSTSAHLLPPVRNIKEELTKQIASTSHTSHTQYWQDPHPASRRFLNQHHPPSRPEETAGPNIHQSARYHFTTIQPFAVTLTIFCYLTPRNSSRHVPPCS